MTRLAFVDTETTGLDDERHHVWEIAVIVGDLAMGGILHNKTEHHYLIRPNLKNADPTALRLTNYYERTQNGGWARADIVAGEVARLTGGTHLVGAVPDFDARFLTRFLRNHGWCPAWHYHLIDVENLVAGKIGVVPPWKSDDLSKEIGVEPPMDRHSAMADARWAYEMFMAVYQ